MAHYMLGEEDPARVALQAALQTSKDFPGKDEAGRRLAMLGIDVKTANAAQVADLRKRLSESPEDPIAAMRLAGILERDGAFDQAATIYQAALKRNPRNGSCMARLAELYASHLNDSRKALELAKEAHNLAPQGPRISHLLGWFIFEAGDAKWAASLPEESARKLPNDPAVLYDLAWAYYGLGRVAEAKAAMQAPAGAPGFPNASEASRFLAMTSALTNLAQTPQAVASIQKALRPTPPTSRPCSSPPCSASGRPNIRKQPSWTTASWRGTRFVSATRNLALLCAEHLGDDRRAYTLAAQARESFRDARSARTLGILAYRQGDYPRSAQLLFQIAREADKDGELLYYLGMAQCQLKQRVQGKESLQRALAST